MPGDGKVDDLHASRDASQEAHVDDAHAGLGALPRSAWIANPPHNECQGEGLINHMAQSGLARNVAKPRYPRPDDAFGPRVGCAHRGLRLTGANRSWNRCSKALSWRVIGSANGNPMTAVYFNP